ncbi:MAG: DUF1893 domain-containing protein [Oscillospiraceae bacterium]|nr:DUF1893 domain-containing protein [Oscillospiraceae bacterium]
METQLEQAQRILLQRGCTCVVLGHDLEFVSYRRGVAPLLELIDSGRCCKGCRAADKVVGKATALLYCLLGVEAIYAQIVSQAAAKVLARHGIALEYATLVPHIENRTGTGKCPMESATEHIDDPRAALEAVRQRLNELNSIKTDDI